MKKKKIKIETPTTWGSVTLKQYLDLQKDIEDYKDNEEALTATLLYHLCGLDPMILPQLDMSILQGIKEDLNGFLDNTDYPLQKFIQIDGLEYGFEPDLSNISYGAYLDITKFDELTIDTNWPYIMNILYRPIVKKTGALYAIEPYKGNADKDKDKWLDVDMEFHFGVFFYFLTLLMDLYQGILNSMKKQPNLPQDFKSILEESGKVTEQLKHSLMGTSLK